MTPSFTSLHALVVPLDHANVNTDAIIPKQFMKSIRRTGFGVNLFDEWRYLDHGEPGQDCSTRPLNPDFVLNQPPNQGAQILLTRENFGCGSSREHAVWALRDFGIRALLAPSFADIFYGNCLTNGLLPVVLDKASIDALFARALGAEGYWLHIDLPAQIVTGSDGLVIHFEIDRAHKSRLIDGLDDIAMTLRFEARISEYESERRLVEPWLFS